MQSSVMMLESSIEKIISSKPVKSPTIDSNGIEKNDIQKLDSDSGPSPAEAEVRLVVRFIVEEHIVYKGKIEKVNQLESEELSRVVSRVAWNGASKSDKINSSEETDKVLSEQVSAQDVPQVLSNSNQSTSSDVVLNNIQSINENSVQIKNISENPPNKTELHTETDISHQEQDPVKVKSLSHEEQIQLINCDLRNECDINEGHLSNFVANHDILQEQSPSQDFHKQSLVETSVIDPVHGQPEFSLSSNPTPESIDYAFEENQLIADALNDCLDKVDRETPLCSTIPSANSLSSLVKNNDVCSLELITSLENSNAANFNTIEAKCTASDTRTASKTGELDRSVHPRRTDPAITTEEAKKVTVSHIRKSDDVTQLATQKGKETVSPSIKRKSSESTSSGKRIRKITNKEQRTSTSRKSTGKTVENVTSRRNSTSGKSTLSMSTGSTNQPTRQIRVFAKWSDNCFYPGLILKRASTDRKYVIGFLDGAQKDIAEMDLIPLCNIEGKQVRVTIAKNYCYNAVVHDQRSPVNDQPMFDVEYHQDGLVRKCVSWKDIFLTGEQGTPLINQSNKNSGASNFADVDLDNIIYDKRSRRIQEMEEFYFTSSSPHRTKTSVLL